MGKRKIVIFSDHPAANSGLARIARDLAIRIDGMDEFSVCSLGYGAHRSPLLPFPQFQWAQNDFFLPFELPMIAREWAENEPFVLMTIGDIQRFLPLADPTFCPDDNLGNWLRDARSKGKMKLWGYFPIDAHGIGGKLPPQLAHTLTHYDRVLVPSEWAAEIVRKTLPTLTVTAIPHGIDTSIFRPHPKQESQDRIGELLFPVMQWPKQAIDIPENALWVGIVATNQSRKDWGLGIEVVSELAKSRPVFLWTHTDKLKHEWSLLELLSDFNLLQSSMVTVGNVSDQTMAIAYSAMNITLGIGRGEGFGYPIFESIFCGTPCFAGSYGAHVEYMSAPYLLNPDHMRSEGPLNLLRPVFKPQNWIRQINKECGLGTPDLAWYSVWPRFSQWFKEGLEK